MSFRARSDGSCATGRRGSIRATLEVSTERISISNEETFERDIGDLERLHDELRRMAGRLAEHLRDRGQTARTVTTKLRYPDFAIRTRSTSLEVGTDDAERIGDARLRSCSTGRCATGPGPLRLVGVGVSGLTEHAQLSLADTALGVPAWTASTSQTEIRVRFAETDAQGVAHNSNYFVWFEVARVDFLERFAGGYQHLRDQGVEALVLEAHARFLEPALLRRPAARPRPLHRRAGRTLQVRVRGRAGRRHDRRRLDSARDRRREDAAPDADPRLAGRGDR